MNANHRLFESTGLKVIGRPPIDQKQYHQNNFQQKCQRKLEEELLRADANFYFLKCSVMITRQHRGKLEKTFSFTRVIPGR
jgi:hypothetical protein